MSIQPIHDPIIEMRFEFVSLQVAFQNQDVTSYGGLITQFSILAAEAPAFLTFANPAI